MRYQSVCLESFGFLLPEKSIHSDEIEAELQPVYDRLKLPAGRLEMMSGISARRVWSAGTRMSALSRHSCELALSAAQFDRQWVGALIHGSVCRDYLEPATACPVHHGLNLSSDCLVYDTSNACLGLLNGMIQAANMIELRQIDAALVVGSESAQGLLASTILELNRNQSLTRQQIKTAIASLTIGSGSCAILLTHADISETGNRLLGAAALANTRHHELCQSHQDQAGESMQPLMNTDSERLMEEGIRTGQQTFEKFCTILDWSRDSIEGTFCHQVGGTHRRLMLQSLGLDPARDFYTFPWLGNTGSVALPLTMAIGLGSGAVPATSHLALLGIGSGINSIMIGVDWRTTQVQGGIYSDSPASFAWSELPWSSGIDATPTR